MDAVDPSIVNQAEHFVSQVPGIEELVKMRIRWVGHRLFAEITAKIDEDRTMVESNSIAQRVQVTLFEAFPAMGEVVVQLQPAFLTMDQKRQGDDCLVDTNDVANILPPRYQNQVPSAAPMGAAGLKYDAEGNAAWDEIWTDFCDLALAGGPSHRSTLLEPGDPELCAQYPQAYEEVLDELQRGLEMVTGLNVIRDGKLGWIGMECDSPEMAIWLLRAIVVENVAVRREGKTLFFPASPDFVLSKEIKNVITVVAKTNHYWQEHLTSQDALPA